jgi:hypothetical protein
MAVYYGVTFDNLRKALYYLYYGIDYPELDAYKYIIPMQQNFFNPIEDMGMDTYIQYFIEDDDRLTQDQYGNNTNYVLKKARCTLRFVGASAELWAKAFHHLSKRKDTYMIFQGVCQASLLEGIGPIKPTMVTFSGKNANIAFDIEFQLEYKESIDLTWLPLENVVLPPGQIS